MPNFSKNTSLFIFLLFLFFFIFSSSTLAAAPWQPSGPPCLPEDAFSPSQTQTCEYKESGPDKPREIRLKWNITPKGSGTQVCWLSCTRTDSGSCNGYWSKDKNGFGTSTLVTKLFAKDDIKVNDKTLKEGNIYQSGCCAKKDPNALEGNFLDQFMNICQEGTLSLSQKMVLKASTPCEVGFGEIINKLDAFQPFIITENSFSDWSSVQEIDLDSKGGSGDRSDLKKAFLGKQCEGISIGDVLDFAFRFRGEATNYFKTYDEKNDAALFTVDYYERTTAGIVRKGYHSLIFLGFDGIPAAGISEENGYFIKIIDSNNPIGVGKPFCKIQEVKTLYNGTKKTFGCIYGGDFIVPFVTQVDKNFTQNLENHRIRSKTGLWLSKSSNIPLIENAAAPGVEGVCLGWDKFVLAVAYLGDFVGTDYHPNDSKYVGKDCDANHYPLSAKRASANSKTWLANVWTSLSNLIKF